MLSTILSQLLPTVLEAFSTVGSRQSYIVYTYPGDDASYMVTIDAFESFLTDEVPF